MKAVAGRHFSCSQPYCPIQASNRKSEAKAGLLLGKVMQSALTPLVGFPGQSSLRGFPRWGSIDSYNYIDFLSGGSSIYTYSGTQAFNATGNVGSPSNFNTGGYFSFMGTDNFVFDSIRLSSENGVAFEFATASVPEPGTLALLSLGLAGLGVARRRKHAA